MGVLSDDDEQLGTPKGKSNIESVGGDYDVDDSCNGDDSVVVDLQDKPSNVDQAHNDYSYTGKLVFVCIGPTTGNFYSPILSTGGSINQSKGEKMRGSRASICKAQEEKATNERVASNGRGITQQNCMLFGIMAQNKDIMMQRRHIVICT